MKLLMKSPLSLKEKARKQDHKWTNILVRFRWLIK